MVEGIDDKEFVKECAAKGDCFAGEVAEEVIKEAVVRGVVAKEFVRECAAEKVAARELVKEVAARRVAAKELAKEVAAGKVAAKEFAKEVVAREGAAKEFAKEIAAKEIAAEEVVVKGRVSQDGVSKEEEYSSRGGLRETVGREVNFKDGFEKELVDLVNFVILIKLVQEDQGGETDGKG